MIPLILSFKKLKLESWNNNIYIYLNTIMRYNCVNGLNGLRVNNQFLPNSI